VTQRYLALLRGVNVGGHTVKMDRLRDLFADLGLDHVRTYIASGNVFFDTDEAPDALAPRVEEHLAQVLGFEVPTILRTPEEVAAVLEGAPFKGITPAPDERFCVTFTREVIPSGVAPPMASPSGDMEIVGVGDRVAYVVWRIRNGRPPSSNFAERTLPAPATTRFYHTLAKILDASRG
jgi:uncharacterized protein (DUF1697 family)